MTSSDPGAEHQNGASPITDATNAGLVTVQLLGLPIPVQARAQEHSDELVRELTLIGEQMRQQGNHGDLPARLVTLVEQLTAEYSAFTGDQEQTLADAMADGQATVDLVYRIPASTSAAAQALEEILDEADEYCRAGEHLLTLPTPPDLVTYRHWFLDQFVDQVGGAEPVSWADYLESAPRSHSAASTPTRR